MEFRNLGNTGLKVSRIGLGCGNFGGVGSAPEFFGQGEDIRRAFRLMDEAVDLGINFFDTANSYGGGRSESFVGQWLQTKPPSLRDQILLSSKVFNPVGEGPNDRGLSRRHVKRQIQESLTRLQVDHLDLYLIHEPDPSTPLEETLDALNDLVHQGRVHYIGASNIEAWRLARSLWVSDRRNWVRFEWVQASFSLLDRRQETEVLPLCLDQGLGFTPYSPLCGGWLTGKYRSNRDFPEGSRMTLRPQPYAHLLTERTFQALAEFEKEAQAKGVEMAALAMAWVLSHPQVCSIIAGPRKTEHFGPIHQALEIKLSQEERERLGRIFE